MTIKNLSYLRSWRPVSDYQETFLPEKATKPPLRALYSGKTRLYENPARIKKVGLTP